MATATRNQGDGSFELFSTIYLCSVHERRVR
jgi:hypothetical protein